MGQENNMDRDIRRFTFLVLVGGVGVILSYLLLPKNIRDYFVWAIAGITYAYEIYFFTRV